MTPGAPVSPAPEGGPLRASAFRRRVWRPATEAAGVAPLRPHDMRHTAVTFSIADGADAKEVATWAGHSSVATVYDRYGHLLPGREERVMSSVEDMYRNVKPTPSGTVVDLREEDPPAPVSRMWSREVRQQAQRSLRPLRPATSRWAQRDSNP